MYFALQESPLDCNARFHRKPAPNPLRQEYDASAGAQPWRKLAITEDDWSVCLAFKLGLGWLAGWCESRASVF